MPGVAPGVARVVAPGAERSLWLLLAAVVIFPALLFAGAAYVAYVWHVAQAEGRLARGVDILYEQSMGVFETLDLVAGRVDELLAGRSDDEVRSREGELYERLRAIAAPLAQVQFILVIDASGHPLVFSGLYPTVRSTDYSGRDYFEAVAEKPGEPFVSAVLQGRLRADSTTFLVATRRNGAGPPDAGGSGTRDPFRGVVAVSTSPAHFAEQFQRIVGHDLDTVTLIRGDGALLARYPGRVDLAGRLRGDSAFMRSIADAPLRGEYETVSDVDGVERMYSYRRLPGHDVYVSAGIDRATVLAAWWATLTLYLSIGLPAVAGLVLLALTALRRTRSEAVAVRQLAERTRELDLVWRTSRDLFAVGDRDGAVRSANPAWTDALGFVPGEVLGRPLAALVHPDDVPLVDQAIERLHQGEIVQDVDLRLRGKGGDEHWYSWTWVPQGELFYASGRDVTERRELAEQLRQSQKMEAVGQLTGGIAHDFNNMLTVVIGSLDMIGRRLDADDTRMRRFVDAAMDGARRAALLTSRLLAFARQQPLRPERADVNALVTGLSELLRGSLGTAIRLETVLAAGLWWVSVDHNQLENVLLNLAVNARDAMPEGGQLTIETRNVVCEGRDASGEHVMVAVTDTGCGMPEAVVAKAFEPFFTTKEIGKGTGLGLSQVYGFVTQSGGHVRLHSVPGEGTRVEVFLPQEAVGAVGRHVAGQG